MRKAVKRVVIVGAGPAGLYLAHLLKRARADFRIEVFEQNPPDATFGFGLAFSERALEFLKREDEETWAAIAPFLEFWNDSIEPDGYEMSSNARFLREHVLELPLHQDLSARHMTFMAECLSRLDLRISDASHRILAA